MGEPWDAFIGTGTPAAMRRCHAEIAIEIRAKLIRMSISEVTDIGLRVIENRVIDIDRLDVAPGIKDVHGGLQGVYGTEPTKGVI